ncbi:hypothetical protein INT45_009163 [Circinella minor]|uniref:Uncharacterized protein n=1 Tax=Circinella minor TaxID=1195481 RepID=A0A8H7SH99_9FUNG|nr:hypothetical protein INT45_009163 [Circinella minor]
MGTHISKTAASFGGENNSETTTDRGSLYPQGLYADSPTDYCVKIVRKFIRDGKLAPFYQGLNDPPRFSITTDQDIALAVTCCPRTTYLPQEQPQDPGQHGLVGKFISARKTMTAQRIGEIPPDSMAYSRVTECPICFLIKRSEDSPLVPVQCPFCVQPNFGVIHVPPKFSPHYKQFSKRRTDLIQYAYGPDNKIRPRRRNRLGPNDPDVILADEIRPDWQRNIMIKNPVQHMSGVGTTRRIIVRPNGEHVLARRRTDDFHSPVLNTFFDTQQLDATIYR